MNPIIEQIQEALAGKRYYFSGATRAVVRYDLVKARAAVVEGEATWPQIEEAIDYVFLTLNTANLRRLILL
jgi:hypothetical protein